MTVKNNFLEKKQNFSSFSVPSGKELIFEVLSLDGLAEMHAYSTDERLYEFLEHKPFNDIDETKQYIERNISRVKSGTALYWFCRRAVDNQLIGTCCLVNIDLNRKSAEWGYGLDPEFWGEGYILHIQEALKAYAFEELGLNRIYSITFVTNKRVIHSLKMAGFEYEGTLRDYYLKNGKHIDGVIYSVLSSDNFARSISTNADTRYSMENIVKIISSVLSSVVVDENSAMCNLAPWDSLSHMNIMLAIKEETGVNLSAKDIAMATSVKNIFELVNLRQSENKK
jgi:ribosomal-protein-alanine N-acetyltransferase